MGKVSDRVPLRVTAGLRRARFRSKIARRPVIVLRHRGLEVADAFLASYPRSGSTWVRFVLAEACSQRVSEFGKVREIVPYVGRHHNAPQIVGSGGRLIHSHETYCDSPRRVVYVARDPRDVALSEYSWQQRADVAPAGFDSFLTSFISGRGNPWGSWGRHVAFWLEQAHLESRLVVKYEELRGDTLSVLKQVTEFLDMGVNAGALAAAIENNSLQQMRNKEDWVSRGTPSGGQRPRFVNTGMPGGWRQRMAPGDAASIVAAFHRQMRVLGYHDE